MMAKCPKCNRYMNESSSDVEIYYECKNCNVVYGSKIKELKIIHCNKNIISPGVDLCLSCEFNSKCISPCKKHQEYVCKPCFINVNKTITMVSDSSKDLYYCPNCKQEISSHFKWTRDSSYVIKLEDTKR